MTAQLQISDSCPHCGQLVAVSLAVTESDERAARVALFVDPSTAAMRAADPRSDHPCPEERQP